MDIEAAIHDERVVFDGCQRWTVQETALEARDRAPGRTHFQCNVSLPEAGAFAGGNQFIRYPEFRRMRQVRPQGRTLGAAGNLSFQQPLQLVQRLQRLAWRQRIGIERREPRFDLLPSQLQR